MHPALILINRDTNNPAPPPTSAALPTDKIISCQMVYNMKKACQMSFIVLALTWVGKFQQTPDVWYL